MTTDSDDLNQQDRYIVIWSKAIETQMHFNDLSVKSRQLGITFVVAALGVAIVLVNRGNDFAFIFPLCGFSFQVHVSVLLFLGACFALQVVKILDVNVYHKMLRGAVAFGEDFEEQYMKQIFQLEKGMTQAISHFSRYKDAQISTPTPGRAYQYTGRVLSTAETKIRKFYKWTTISILAGAVLLLIATNVANWKDMNKGVDSKNTLNSAHNVELEFV